MNGNGNGNTQGNAAGNTQAPEPDNDWEQSDNQASGNTTGNAPNSTTPNSDAGNPPPTPDAETDDKGKRVTREDAEKKYSSRQVTNIVQREIAKEQAKNKLESERRQQEASGEFEKLYRATLLEVERLKAELTARDDTIDALREMVAKQIDGEIKDWDTDLLATDPATEDPEGYDIQARLKWVTRTRNLAAKLNGNGPVHGNGPGPKPAKPSPTGQGNGNGNGSGGTRPTGQGGNTPPGTEQEYIDNRRRTKPIVI
jgi:hypothetical protein